MSHMNVTSTATATAITRHTTATGKPSRPMSGRQPLIERKISDPSSATPKEQGYPIPAFFEYRIKPKEFDPL